MSISLSPVTSIAFALPIVLSIIYYLRVDGAEYADFKTQANTASRQAFYRRWTIRSFLIYSIVTIVVLGLFGRLNALIEIPKEFVHLTQQLRDIFSPENEIFDPTFVRILVATFIISSIVSPSIIAYLSRGRVETAPTGDVLPLIPRNRAERFWGFAISVNAGISEELFFRLLLPLLFTYIFGNAHAAFALAAVLFGLVHCCQGWAGAIAATVAGLLLTLVYLATGNIWLAVLAHVALDLNGLLLQPFLKSLLR